MMTLEQMEDAIRKIAAIMTSLYGSYRPECGGDFSDHCHGDCSISRQCEIGIGLGALVSELWEIIESD